MAPRDNTKVFDRIAPVFGWFFSLQRRNFAATVERTRDVLDLSAYRNILDVGCGTGALASVLSDIGLDVTALDPAPRMLEIARAKTDERPITFVQGNVLEGLPFADQSFDITIASHVAHGLQPDERQRMYREMLRVTRHQVIIHDYNDKRAPLVTLIEWLEQGDYFNFILQAEEEMRRCEDGGRPCFSGVTVQPIGERGSWYICTPNREDSSKPVS